MKDLAYALRSLRRQPAFTLITMLTLVLGIGANTAVFSVVNGVLLRPLPYPQPEQLEYITSQFPGLGFNQFWVSPPEFVEFRDNNQSFSSVGAYSVGAVNLEMTPPVRPVSAFVTPELMPTLGVNPYRGRWFNAEDSAPNAPPVVDPVPRALATGCSAATKGFWARASGSMAARNRSSASCRRVTTSTTRRLRSGGRSPSTAPTSRIPAAPTSCISSGRLKDGVTREQALADMERLLNQWRAH